MHGILAYPRRAGAPARPQESGFIAVKASLASGLVDVTLIPEVPFRLEGPRGLLAYLDSLLESQVG